MNFNTNSNIEFNFPFIKKDEFVEYLKSLGIYNNYINDAISQVLISHKNHYRYENRLFYEEHIFPVVKCIIEFYINEHMPIKEIIIVAAIVKNCLDNDIRLTEKNFVDTFGYDVYNIVSILSKPSPNLYEITSKFQRYKQRTEDFLRKLDKTSLEIKIIELSTRYNDLLSSLKFQNKDELDYFIYETKEYYLPFAKNNCYFFYTKMRQIIDKLEKLFEVQL